MSKGYWIVRVDVSDDAAYQQYVAANGAAFSKFQAQFLVRGGAHEVLEGEARSRNVVIEFPSYQHAVDCYRSTEYQHAKSLRDGAGIADILVIEGYIGPQPSA